MAKYYVGPGGVYAGGWDGDTPSDNSLTEVSSAPPSASMLWNGSSWVYPATALKALAADKRYRVETAGITALGAPIKTDRESQAMISAAHAFTGLSGQPVKWKLANGGFSQVSAAQIQQIAIAVGNHVQGCFAAEADICDLIDAGTITDADGVENWSGWPA